MNRWTWWVAGLCAVAVAARADTGVLVRVKGDRVNLRARPVMESETVGQVSDGETLRAISIQEAWVEVTPPASIDLWVHRDFLKGNSVNAAKLYVRGGPGINYSVVGNMGRGETVKTRGEFGEWLKIEPPAASSLWVSREFVQIVEPDKQKPRPPVVAAAPPAVVTPPPAPPASNQVASTPSSKPAASVPSSGSSVPPPPDLDLIPLEGQGKFVQREGELRLVGFMWRRPSRFRIVQNQGNSLRTVCYVRGNTRQLEELLGRTLILRGREFWGRGVKYPVLVPEQIIPRTEP